MSATSLPPSVVAMAIGASVAGGAVGSSTIAVPSRSSTPSVVELAAQFVAQGVVVGTDEDVVGDVGDRDVFGGEERLDLAGELEAGRAGADD